MRITINPYPLLALVWVCLLCFQAYRLGLNKASLNVHDYDSINTSIHLACTAMIDKEPMEEVQEYIDSYNFIRDAEKLLEKLKND